MIENEKKELKEGIEKGIKKGIKEGKLEGIKEGIKERNYKIAKNLKQMNMDDASISKATGLSIEEVRNINADGEKL